MRITDRYPYAVYRTQFHNGGLISRHATPEAAAKAVRKAKIGDCMCGCAVAVGPQDPRPKPAAEVRWPYSAAA